MDLNAYIDRIEAVVEDPGELRAIWREVADDSTLSAADRAFLDERVGTYLADVERSAG